MEKDLLKLQASGLDRIRVVASLPDLEALEIQLLGRKGELTQLLRGLGALPESDRKRWGDLANTVKRELELAIKDTRHMLAEQKIRRLGEEEWLDITSPGEPVPLGHVHIVTSAIREIERIFARIGFVRSKHPEVDWDWYAFESLNMPKDHPARDEWETFFVGERENHVTTDPKFGRMVLTPHTSNAQVREMQKGQLPIRMINIAKCYRRQSDASHVPMFHQFEGLYIDKHVTIQHLKGVLDYFAKSFFGPERRTRLRPFHFRFTEPSFELDISCGVCGGTGLKDGAKCGLCKQGWHELGGAGMTHPNVLRAGGIDPEKYSAFAFGWGVERTYMMKEGLSIPDIRLLYRNDLRFLEQL